MVVAGLLACVMSITRIYMMGTVFNTFALVAGLFLIGDNVANFRYAKRGERNKRKRKRRKKKAISEKGSIDKRHIG